MRRIYVSSHESVRFSVCGTETKHRVGNTPHCLLITINMRVVAFGHHEDHTFISAFRRPRCNGGRLGSRANAPILLKMLLGDPTGDRETLIVSAPGRVGAWVGCPKDAASRLFDDVCFCHGREQGGGSVRGRKEKVRGGEGFCWPARWAFLLLLESCLHVSGKGARLLLPPLLIAPSSRPFARRRRVLRYS